MGKKVIRLTESEMIQMIENIVVEVQKKDVKWSKNYKKYYDSNKYELDGEDQNELLNLIDDIKNEVNRYDDSVITIKMKGCESKTPNIFNTKKGKQQYPPLSMAKKRAHSMKKFLQNQGGDLLKGVNYVIDNPIQSGPDYNPSANPNSPEYKDAQYVELMASVDGNLRKNRL